MTSQENLGKYDFISRPINMVYIVLQPREDLGSAGWKLCLGQQVRDKRF